MPLIQVTYAIAEAPSRRCSLKVPSPRDDSAQEWSTTAWPFSARRSQPPLNEGPTAALIGRKREFISMAAATAAPGPPPAPRSRRRELRRPGEHDRREGDRGERREAGLLGEDPERHRKDEAGDRERRADAYAAAKALVAEERAQFSTK